MLIERFVNNEYRTCLSNEHETYLNNEYRKFLSNAHGAFLEQWKKNIFE